MIAEIGMETYTIGNIWKMHHGFDLLIVHANSSYASIHDKSEAALYTEANWNRINSPQHNTKLHYCSKSILTEHTKTKNSPNLFWKIVNPETKAWLRERLHVQRRTKTPNHYEIFKKSLKNHYLNIHTRKNKSGKKETQGTGASLFHFFLFILFIVNFCGYT